MCVLTVAWADFSGGNIFEASPSYQGCLPSNRFERMIILVIFWTAIGCSSVALVLHLGYICGKGNLEKDVNYRFLLLIVFSVGDYATDSAYCLTAEYYNPLVHLFCFLAIIAPLIHAVLLWLHSLFARDRELSKISYFGRRHDWDSNMMDLVFVTIRIICSFMLFLVLLVSRVIVWAPALAFLNRFQGICV